MPEVVLTIACQEFNLVINPAQTQHTCSTQKSKTSLQSPSFAPIHHHQLPSLPRWQSWLPLHLSFTQKQSGQNVTLRWLFSYKKTPEPYFHVTVRLCTFCTLLFFLLPVCKFTKVSARIESNVIEDTSHKLKKMHFPSQSKFDSWPNWQLVSILFFIECQLYFEDLRLYICLL